ncbi:MAG: AAA family ATPase [Acidobacteriota bacterium]|nr:AAA family ATPase [Acidobacteriota bacterium]
MKILAIYNIKGGVGKTVTAVNLAHLAASQGFRTLVCDLDPQSATTFYFRVKPKAKVKSLIEGGKFLDRYIKETDYPGLDLLPADFSFRNLDIAFAETPKPNKRLRATLKGVRDDYDLVLLDCPPNLTKLTENVFHAADYLVHPTIPTTLSTRTLIRLVEFFRDEGLDERRILPFFSMVEKRKSLHRELMASLPREMPGFLQTPVPYLSEIERMGVYREPATAFKGQKYAARVYGALWEELCQRVGLTENT